MASQGPPPPPAPWETQMKQAWTNLIPYLSILPQVMSICKV